MQSKGWRATDLARESGLTEGAVSRHLERTKTPRLDSVERYCKALGVGMQWLAYGREEASVPPQPKVETMLGSAALERVLAVYEWPDVDIAIVDAVVADARTEAFASGQDRPESAWRLRVTQLLRERTGRAKAVPTLPTAEVADLTEESPEIRAGRKRPRRL